MANVVLIGYVVVAIRTDQGEHHQGGQMEDKKGQ